MNGLDTNVLVRLLVADDAAQTQRVVQRFQAAERDGERLFVSILVLLELAWVLESAYGCTRTEVLDALEQLTSMPVLRIDNLEAVHRAIALGRQSKQAISNLLIGCCTTANGCTSVLTFDKAAAKHELFEQL